MKRLGSVGHSWQSYWRHWRSVLLPMRDYLLDLVYARGCAICGARLGSAERCLCLECAANLPRYHEAHTLASERLLGSPLVRSLSALTTYHHDMGSHYLITSLKYEGYTELASFIVRTAWTEGRLIPKPGTIDFIMPVPIEPKRYEKRGYNQAMLLAEALAEYYHCPATDRYLKRQRGSSSQTKLRRRERMENAASAFSLSPYASKHNDLRAKRILLVDDLLTTGSTLLSVCDQLEALGVAEVHIFVAAVAIRVH